MIKGMCKKITLYSNTIYLNNSNKGTTCYIDVTKTNVAYNINGNAALVSNLSILPTGTPVEGTYLLFFFNANVVPGGYSIYIFNTYIQNWLYSNKFVILCTYSAGNWHVNFLLDVNYLDDIVDLSSSQVLLNKTISASNNTLTSITSNSISESSKTGNGSKLVTGTAFTNKMPIWDSNGNLSLYKTPPTGDIVGDTDSQELENKIIDGDKNSISNIGLSSVDIELKKEVLTFNVELTGTTGSVYVKIPFRCSLSASTNSVCCCVLSELTVRDTEIMFKNAGGNNMFSAALTIPQGSVIGSLSYATPIAPNNAILEDELLEIQISQASETGSLLFSICLIKE